jgi:hypothetical protein
VGSSARRGKFKGLAKFIFKIYKIKFTTAVFFWHKIEFFFGHKIDNSNSGCCGPRSKGRGLVSCSSTPPSSACRNAPISSASTCPYPHFTTPHTPHAHFTRHLYHTFSAPISSANTYPYPPSTTPHTLYDTHLPHILVLEFPLQVTPMLQSPLYWHCLVQLTTTDYWHCLVCKLPLCSRVLCTDTV